MRLFSKTLMVAVILSCLAASSAFAGTIALNFGAFTSPPGGTVGFSSGSTPITGNFDHFFTFSLTGTGAANSQVGLSLLTGKGLKVTYFDLYRGTPNLALADGGGTLLTSGHITISTPGYVQWYIDPTVLTTGNFYIRLQGGLAPGATSGSYGGDFNINSVPEPSVLLLLALGIGAVGFAPKMTKR
jgi:hypothetical protein